MSSVYFISDLHLGAHDDEFERQKEERLLSFLRFVARENADLVIVGDLFDFWFEYKHVILRRHFRVLGQLALMTGDRPIHYLAGNHDFWLDSFISNEIGLIIHPNEYVLSVNHLKIFVRHGDGLLKNDYGYRMLKKVLRNKFNIFLYRLLHPDIGVPLALYCSHLSRNSGEKDKERYLDIDYRRFAFQKIDEGYDMVVLGHTHWAALEAYQSGCYVNPGYWGNNFTFAVVQDGRPAIQQWDGKEAKPFLVDLPPGNQKYYK